MIEQIEDILLPHVLTSELRLKDITCEEHQDVLEVYYNNSILLRIFMPKNINKNCRLFAYSSKLKVPGFREDHDRNSLLEDIKKISNILNDW